MERDSFTVKGQENGIAGFFLIAVIVYAAVWFVMNHTTLGHGVYAIGQFRGICKASGDYRHCTSSCSYIRSWVCWLR